jgi:hypothetical protein
MGCVSDFLVVYLDSIDERLLEYLDEDEELRPEVVKRLCFYTSALQNGSITPAAVAEDRADWFDLTRAFVAACAPEAVEELEEAAPLMSVRRGGGHRTHPGGQGVLRRRRSAPRRLPRDAAGEVAHSAGNALFTASVRSASERCRYLVVVAMLECPSRRWTTWMSTPRRSRLVA